MNCLIKFLGDSYQNKLRILAQANSERYEQAIDNYAKLFISHFRNELEDCGDDKCEFKDGCTVIRDSIMQISDNDILEFFTNIKDVYSLWIDAKSKEALEKFEKILDDKKIFEFKKDIKTGDIYFKGRLTDQVLTTWDMFHIPFNKRYLISNQRYSLTGQPIVYIGSSVLDIAEELELKKIGNFKVSSVKIPEDLKIYDFRNDIYDNLIDIDFYCFLEIESDTYTPKNFYKTILSSICSFRKKGELKGYSFCEEYVLPQIFAQQVKNKGYQGIAYYSTKKFENLTLQGDNEIKINNDDFYHDFGYKENIAIFTQLNETHVYDKDLYEKINISVPIGLDKIEKISITDLDEMKNEINKTQVQEKTSEAEIMVSSFKRIYDRIKIGEVSYLETDIGQLHAYQLYIALNEILFR